MNILMISNQLSSDSLLSYRGWLLSPYWGSALEVE